MLAAAIDYALAGFAVLPLNGKVPRIEGGLKRASLDVGVLAGWWQRWPDANVGVRTGEESGLVVLDVDVQHGGGKTLAAIERRHGKLGRPHVLTGGGGHHYMFAHPGHPVQNSAGALGPGIDVRGDGGYIVAPPSVHESGRPYKLLRPFEQREPPPAWMLEQTTARNGGTAAPVDETIPEGRRHHELLSLAGTMRRRGMSGDEILAALTVANTQRCLPPLPDEELAQLAQDVSRRYEPAAKQQPAPDGDGRLEATPVADLTMRSVEWREKPLWQRSAFQLLAGPKGSGKGTYLAGLAARVTRSGERVLVVSSEDSAEIDLKPRLVAAGADIDLAFVIRQHVRLPDDIEQLRTLANHLGGIGLLIVDPVANHIGHRNSNSDAEVRDAIGPLNRLADELDCLLIGVRHPGKDRSRGAVASILGSTAWVDTPRAVVMIAVDDEDPLTRHIQVVAGNRSLNGSAQAFRIDAVDVSGLSEPITVAVALGESAKSVDTLLAARGNDNSRSGQARELLLDIIETGDQESDTLDARVAQETGLAAGTVRNARMALKNEGLIKMFPEKDELGTILLWKVGRTAAPR